MLIRTSVTTIHKENFSGAGTVCIYRQASGLTKLWSVAPGNTIFWKPLHHQAEGQSLRYLFLKQNWIDRMEVAVAELAQQALMPAANAPANYLVIERECFEHCCCHPVYVRTCLASCKLSCQACAIGSLDSCRVDSCCSSTL